MGGPMDGLVHRKAGQARAPWRSCSQADKISNEKGALSFTKRRQTLSGATRTPWVGHLISQEKLTIIWEPWKIHVKLGSWIDQPACQVLFLKALSSVPVSCWGSVFTRPWQGNMFTCCLVLGARITEKQHFALRMGMGEMRGRTGGQARSRWAEAEGPQGGASGAGSHVLQAPSSWHVQ